MTGDSVIGRSVRRVGGLERVTGAQRYTADIHLDHELHVKLVHLDCARARLIAIDTSEALRVPGVRCVLTAADLPQPVPRFGPVTADRPVLATGETKFFGEPVAAVAAETLDAAEAGAALVRVEYERLPAVLTVEEALAPESPLVREPEMRPGDRHATTNILQSWQFGWGDPTTVDAPCIVERTYTFPMVTHFAIEPHVFLAQLEQDGMAIWSPTQHPFVLQRVVAAVLGWPLSKVRIIAPDPGGAFGGKGWPKFEPLVAFLALKTRRAIRLVLSLEETFQAARRTSARVHARTGFDRDGRILFQDLQSDFLLGAYADIGVRVVSKASYAGCGPYRVPHARVRARALLSHTTPSTAFRGFGTPQMSWATEQQLNEGGARLGFDPLEMRLRNVAARNEAFIPGDTPADGDWLGSLKRAAEAIEWTTPLPKHRARGISLGLKSSSTASASFAIVRLHFDGSATIFSGTSDMGQGARTVLVQIAAEALGITTDRVAIVMGDTSTVPFDSSTSASRSSVFMGHAVLNACLDIRTQLAAMAAELTGAAEDAIAVTPGTIRIGDQQMSYTDVLRQHFGSTRGEVVGMGHKRSRFIADHPLGGKPVFWELMCAAADVEVDIETGMPRLHRIILVSDIGKALNPAQVHTQDEGAAVMGLGHTLMEQILLDANGRIRNLGALDYRIPTILDIPDHLHSILIENEDGPGPHGAKGAGEGGILAIAAAVGAAINEAAGIALRDLPLTPERVWRAVRDKAQREAQANEALANEESAGAAAETERLARDEAAASEAAPRAR